ncbi:hypothetical protein G6F70_002025 [Rhizopus microsporus]|nr:hypothetical protein G6F71_006711 [Rhizopus microsporus]KAG1202700.1 hypothetical protein G6F70_002025 [Rhizopus microsporus]KAG1209090.1 hypothetical protein G6F69_006667 [Rhizopus microsporus]KAG1227501.1 hypothetical protein G6F67_008409 [Rhizopus microsporus]KAG1259336.1 hypothetical protein G6F68_008190 [Rhizopus microsporus]
MDCEFNNSSDILFPSDTGLPKLSSPLDYKVPEAHDWAIQDFMHTFHDKASNELNNFLSFKQYIPVQEQQQQPMYEEKQILSQVTQHLAMGHSELHDILKGFFHSVQNSMQINSYNEVSLPGLSWAEEANEYYGGNDIGNLDTIQELEKGRRLNTPPQLNTNMMDMDDLFDTESVDSSLSEMILDKHYNQDKPLPPLPQKSSPSKKLFNKIKSKTISNTKKVFRKLFHVS